MNWKNNLFYISAITTFLGILMIVPTILSFTYHETVAQQAFLKTLLYQWSFSFIAFIISRKRTDKTMGTRDGYFLVTMAWVIGTAFSALPLFFSHSYPDYVSAYFEIMSGFTTTGATVLTNFEDTALSILFWRSETNWIGGMGIVVLFVALLPVSNTGGVKLVGAESVGPTKDKLTPKIKNTAIILWSIYFGFSVLETILLSFGGLDLYEAVTVTFSTMAAAGFCVKSSSIGTFGSVYVDIVVTIFMLIGGANFALYYKALSGRFKSVLKDEELRLYIAIWAICTMLVSLSLYFNGTYGSFGQSLRFSAFQNASIITTTGFSTANYCLWPSFTQMILLLLFFVGGCAGSAGGGIKVIRILTVFKAANVHIKKRLHPNGVFNVRISGNTATHDVIISITGFIAIYVATGLIGAALAALSGQDIATSFAASFLCLGNIGIGFGNVGPTNNFAFFHPMLKWMFAFMMLAGRLELFTVYALFSRSFWKK